MPSAADYKLARAAVAALAAGQAAVTEVHLCPLCDGGATGELSLSLTVLDGQAMFCCHRAKCNFRGYLNGGIDTAGALQRAAFKPRIYRGETITPPAGSYWYDRVYGTVTGYDPDITPDRAFARARMAVEARDTRCLVTEIVGLDGVPAGHVTRAVDADGRRHVRTWRLYPDLPFYNVYRRSTGPIWLVEDSLSAFCVYLAGSTGLALLGVNMTGGLGRVLLMERRPVVVALDPGAERAAGRIYEDLQALGVNVRIQPLLADIKDMQAKEATKLIHLWEKAFKAGI